MIRKTLTLRVAALAMIATLGSAAAATPERIQGTVLTMDRAAQTATLLDGTRLQFEGAAQMRLVQPDAQVHVAFVNGGDRNLVTGIQVQLRP